MAACPAPLSDWTGEVPRNNSHYQRKLRYLKNKVKYHYIIVRYSILPYTVLRRL